MNDLLFTKIPDHNISLTGNSMNMTFSPDGKYACIGGYEDSLSFHIYKIDGERFTKLPNPDIFPSYRCSACAFSPDSKYLIIGLINTPFLYIYERNGDEFNKVDNINILPNNYIKSIQFSNNSEYLCITTNSHPRIYIYKRNGDEFVKLPDPSVIPTSTAHDCSFSPDLNHLTVTQSNKPYFITYKRNGDEFVKLPDPSIMPNGYAKCCTYSPNGEYLAMGGISSPFLTVYKRNGNTFTLFPYPNQIPTDYVRGINFSYDSKYLIAATDDEPSCMIYEIDGNSMHYKPSAIIPPSPTPLGCSLSYDNKLLAVHTNCDPYITIYKSNIDYVKFLLESNSVLKTINANNQIEDLNDNVLDSDLFKYKGITLDQLNKNMDIINSLEKPLNMLHWNGENNSELEVRYKHSIPKRHIVSMEVDEYDQLGDSIKIISNTNKLADLEITEDSLVTTTIKYVLSKDNINWYGFNGTAWVKDYYMTKEELEGLDTAIFQQWVGESIYKYNLYIKYFIDNQDIYSNAVVKNISLEYNENQKPIIIDPIITPNEIHAEFAILTATLKDLEGDILDYKVSIQKADESEFVIADDWDRVPKGNKILRAYNQPYFNLGSNVVKLEVRDQRGLISEWTTNVLMVNTKPTMLITYDNFGINATIDDVDGDKANIQISINNNIVYPFDILFATPANIKYKWDTKHTPFGKQSVVKVEIKDSFDEIVSETFTITGEYKNILFMDEEGNYYSSDRGIILKTLNFDTVTLPEYSEPRLIKLKNNTTYPLKNVSVESINIGLPDNTSLEFSESLNPFNPKEILQLVDVMNHGDIKDIYLRVKTTEGRGNDNIIATISSTGNIVY